MFGPPGLEHRFLVFPVVNLSGEDTLIIIRASTIMQLVCIAAFFVAAGISGNLLASVVTCIATGFLGSVVFHYFVPIDENESELLDNDS